MNGDPRSLEKLIAIAATGQAKAQVLLCIIYVQGFGVPKNEIVGKDWCLKAKASVADFSMAIREEMTPIALSGNVEAQLSLGVSLSSSDIPQDKAEGLKWLTKAAESGNALAQFQLASAYHDQDPSTALIWYRKSAESGYTMAQTYLASIYKGLRKGQASTDVHLAAHWYRKAAEAGDPLGQVHLAEMYEEGVGVPKDLPMAAHWYRKAAEAGDDSAQLRLGQMYDLGEGLAKDPSLAVFWYRKGAEQRGGIKELPQTHGGYAIAKARAFLGAHYCEGNGVPKDVVVCYMWLNLASAGGNKIAAELRNTIEKRMTPDQVAEAQRLAREWKPKD